MAQGVAIGRVRQRADQCPVPAAFGQLRQMLADVDAGRGGLDRLKVAPDSIRGTRLQVEAVLLGQSPGKKDVEHRLRGAGSGRRRLHVRCPQRLQMIGAQTDQSQRARLDGGST